MKRQIIPELVERRPEIEAVCRRFAVRWLELFGSAATGAFRNEDSDLDFLVEFQDPAGPGYANRIFGLQESTRELLGKPVDLVVDSAITNPYFREPVVRGRALLYAA